MKTLSAHTGAFLLWMMCVLPLFAQVRWQPPIERSGFTRLTSYDSLQTFLKTIDGSGGLTVAPCALTRGGRIVSSVLVTSSPHFGEDTLKLRVMLFAQQHGDEPAGKEALTILLAHLASHELGDVLSHVDLMIVPQMNPDGAELRQRRTADSVDLNRNHLLLTAPETRGLHSLFDAWWPQVTMDMHEYGAYSRSWIDSGFVKSGDVQLGMLTNLNSSAALRSYERDSVFPFLASAMRRGGYSFHEYIVGSPQDSLRYSTTEPNDGRQSFGILNTLSFIQEGRGGQSLEENLERRAKSQYASLEALLKFCAARAGEIRTLVARERRALQAGAGTPVVLTMDHVPGPGNLIIPVRRVPSGRDTVWQVRPLRSRVVPLCTRTLPSAYLIPRELDGVREVLERNFVLRETVRMPRTVDAVVYAIERVVPDTLEGEWHPLPFLRSERVRRTLRPGDVVVRTDQVRSLFTAILLEPESMWGLVKYPGFSSLIQGKE